MVLTRAQHSGAIDTITSVCGRGFEEASTTQEGGILESPGYHTVVRYNLMGLPPSAQQSIDPYDGDAVGDQSQSTPVPAISTDDPGRDACRRPHPPRCSRPGLLGAFDRASVRPRGYVAPGLLRPDAEYLPRPVQRGRRGSQRGGCRARGVGHVRILRRGSVHVKGGKRHPGWGCGCHRQVAGWT